MILLLSEEMVPRRRPQQQENAQCIDARAVFYPRHHRMTMQLRIDNGRLDQLASSALRKDKRETSGRRVRLTGSVCPVPYYGCGPFLWASFPGRCGGRVRLFPSTSDFCRVLTQPIMMIHGRIAVMVLESEVVLGFICKVLKIGSSGARNWQSQCTSGVHFRRAGQ